MVDKRVMVQSGVNGGGIEEDGYGDEGLVFKAGYSEAQSEQMEALRRKRTGVEGLLRWAL